MPRATESSPSPRSPHPRRRGGRRRSARTALAGLGLAAAVSLPAGAADPVPDAAVDEASAASTDDAASIGILVFRLGGTGSSSRAQGYIDTLVANVAAINGWAGAVGKYVTSISKADAFIKEASPHYGFLSLDAFLGLRKAQGLTLLGTVTQAQTGGGRYYLISKSALTVADCKGKSLASNLVHDARYIDNVVSGDVFDLSDFTLVETKRPVQTLKAVINDEAQCALVDDAQLAELAHVDGGDAVHAAWFSPAFPALVVASFSSAPKEEAATFKANLAKICEGDGKSACDAAGIEALAAAEATELDAVVEQYDR